MPFKRIDGRRLRGIKTSWSKIRKGFSRMPSLDQRNGSLVREYRGLAIKKCHSGTASKVINSVQSKVRLHNQTHRGGGYKLLFPWAYELDRNYLVMAKIKAPTVADILHFKTEAGTRFFEKMKRVHGVTEKQLRNAYERANNNTENFFFMPDLFLVGCRKGEFLFLPTMDLH